MKYILFSLLSIALTPNLSQGYKHEPHFKRIITIIFENESQISTMSVPFFAKLAKAGANFTRFYGETHPSQPNYIAMTSGSVHDVKSNSEVNLDVKSIADLLDARRHTWKVYAEDFPGGCFKGMGHSNYVRKHVPFMSYTRITSNPERCANVVGLEPFFSDWKKGTLPNYSYVVPNQQNNAHDTNIKFAGEWFEKTFSPYLSDPKLMEDTLFVVTFDEGTLTNRIYTVFYGPSVIPGSENNTLHNHYSLLKLVEDEWALGNLGLEDAKAPFISGIWK